MTILSSPGATKSLPITWKDQGDTGVTIGDWSGGTQTATLSISGITQSTIYTCLVTGSTGQQHPHSVAVTVNSK